MVEIDRIDYDNKTIYLKNGDILTVDKYRRTFAEYFNERIAGETILPSDMERFMYRTSSKNLHLLMKGKKMEGYLEGVSTKFIPPGTKLAIGTIITIIFVGIIILVILKSQGLIPGL